MEKTIWLESGSEVKYCPYCKSIDIRPSEVCGLWTCQECQKDFIVRRRKPEPKPKSKGISPDELWERMKKAGIA